MSRIVERRMTYKVKTTVSPDVALTLLGLKVKVLLGPTSTLCTAAWTAKAAKRAKVARESILSLVYFG
jgi:hypothetical protein